jgi:hypothetical protein
MQDRELTDGHGGGLAKPVTFPNPTGEDDALA